MNRSGAVLKGLAGTGRLLFRPLTLLVLQLLLVFLFMSQSGGLEPAWVADSHSYGKGSEAATVTQALSHYRTYGYPLLLKTLGRSRLPPAGLLIYLSSVILFWFALRGYTGSSWLAFAAAVPLAYHPVLVLARLIQPDFLSTAMVVVAVSCLLLLAVRTSRPGAWSGLVVAVFAAYQLRPAAVFLVALIPVLGWVLRLCRSPTHPWRLWRWAAALACATAMPYLAFAGVRWITVGHFGLVPFGGTNLAGLTANFLDDQLVASLPKEQRDLARRMLRARQNREWQPLTRYGDIEESFRQYSNNMFQIAIPAAERQVKIDRRRATEEGTASVDERRKRIVRNEMLGRLSWSIIRLRPFLYLKWVRSALKYGLDQLLDFGWIRWPLLLLVCSLPVALLRGPTARLRHAPGDGPAEASPDLLLLGLLVLGLGYFLAYLFLVSLVSFPFLRYFRSMILFLPSALCAELFEIWRGILAPRQPGSSG